MIRLSYAKCPHCGHVDSYADPGPTVLCIHCRRRFNLPSVSESMRIKHPDCPPMTAPASKCRLIRGFSPEMVNALPAYLRAGNTLIVHGMTISCTAPKTGGVELEAA